MENFSLKEILEKIMRTGEETIRMELSFPNTSVLSMVPVTLDSSSDNFSSVDYRLL